MLNLADGGQGVQARVQADQLAASHRAQADQQKAQADAIHQQVKVQAEIELARVKAELDAKMTLLDAHLKAAMEAQKMQRAPVPGSRKARDGQHYVADPKRPGKFLMVVHHA